MNVRIVCVGKLKEKYLKDGIEEYAKRLSRFCKFEIIEVSEELLPDTSQKNIHNVKTAEGERIIAKLKGYAIALDLKGKMLTSQELSQKIKIILNILSTDFIFEKILMIFSQVSLDI